MATSYNEAMSSLPEKCGSDCQCGCTWSWGALTLGQVLRSSCTAPKTSENQKSFYNSIGLRALTDRRLSIIFIPLSETVLTLLCTNTDVSY